MIGHDLNLKAIEEISLTISLSQKVTVDFMQNPDAPGNIPIVKLVVASSGQEVFLAPNDKPEWIQLDSMLEKWVSPITNDSIIQVYLLVIGEASRTSNIKVDHLQYHI